MPDVPAAVQAAVRAVASHPWGSAPRTAHSQHRYDAGCAVCRADLPAIVAAALDAAAPLIAEQVRAEERAALARIRAAHRVHRCAVDAHLLARTPTPCQNNGLCSCGYLGACPTAEILDTLENTCA